MNDDALVQPLDEHDQRLLAQVCPEGWRNPDPAPVYDLVVIGGGTAGLVCAAGAAGLGARVAPVERGRLGGDCLNTGCVPSKALLRAARAVHEARTVAVDGRALRFRRAVIATGGRPSIPQVPGLVGAPYLTSENLFELVEQPRTLLVIGGGPIGCEMAQAFALLGTAVTLIEAAPRLLPREDADAADIIARRLGQDGVRIATHTTIAHVARSGDRVTLQLIPGATAPRYDSTEAVGDGLLVAVGRSPNVEGLNLKDARVKQGADGVEVDDRLRSSNHRIYAAGDVCSRFQFTHAADAMARIVIENALFHGRRRASRLVIPWSTYTFPEVAHVGLAPDEAARAGSQRITIPLSEVDRAVIDGESDGFLRIHHQGGRMIAATLVAPRAGELIGHIAAVMRRRGSLGDFSDEVFPYPTLADALRKAGDAYRRTRLTRRVRTLLQRYFALVRRM